MGVFNRDCAKKGKVDGVKILKKVMGHRLFFDEPERYTSTTRCNNHIDFFSAFPVEILQKKRQSQRRRNNHRGLYSSVQWTTCLSKIVHKKAKVEGVKV